MGMKRAALKGLGITFLVFMLATSTIAIILAGIVYRFANPDFVPNGWSALSGTMIACIIYAFFMAFMGFCAFLYPKTWLLGMYSAMLFLSMMFTLAIAIYSLIAGSTHYPNVQQGCNAQISGVLNVFKNMDTYLINVDRALCSPDCPCRVANTAPFANNPNTTASYATWTLTDQLFAATAFQNCSSAVQANVLTSTATQNTNFPANDFNSFAFADYMGRVEREFSCTGWCNVVYLSPASTSPITFSKYLFSDINRGPPINVGCIQRLLEWLPGYLLAYGSVAMVLFGIETILFGLAIALASSRKSEESHDVIHHERVEVIERQ